MTPQQRREWRAHVLGSGLTPSQKNVVLALEMFADYRDGTNAHPGEARLAEMCRLQPRAVRYALERAQKEFGLIERTQSAKPRLGLADAYRLIFTGTAMPVNASITGTAMPVKEVITGTATTALPAPPQQDYRHGDDSFTGTAMPPTYTGTYQSPSPHREESPESGTSPGDADDGTARPHSPTAAANRNPRCPLNLCDDAGWLLGNDGTPVEPARKCNHTAAMHRFVA